MKNLQKTLPAIVLLMVMAGDAVAGGTGGAFIQPLLNFLIEGLKGYVGTTIAVMALFVSLIAAVTGNAKALVISGIIAIAAYYGPDLLSAISSATVAAF